MVTKLRLQTVYDCVCWLLSEYPELRESDKKLIWTYWTLIDQKAYDCQITERGFMSATAPESITRAARKARELYPHLRGSKSIQDTRKIIELEVKKEMKKLNKYNYKKYLEGEIE